MSAPPDEVRRLRELHDLYVWEVNAAIGEGRQDLAWELADDYFDMAVRAMTEDHPPACERRDCAMCARPRYVPPGARLVVAIPFPLIIWTAGFEVRHNRAVVDQAQAMLRGAHTCRRGSEMTGHRGPGNAR